MLLPFITKPSKGHTETLQNVLGLGSVVIRRQTIRPTIDQATEEACKIAMRDGVGEAGVVHLNGAGHPCGGESHLVDTGTHYIFKYYILM